MKVALILFFLIAAITFKSVKPVPFNDGGLNYILTDGNDDPNSCIQNISYVNHANKISFSVTTVYNPAPDCTHHDLQFWSMFRGDNLWNNVSLVQSGNVASGDLTLAMIQSFNGTACLFVGYKSGNANNDYYYNCQFRYNNIYFILTFGINNVSNQIDTNWVGQLNPIAGATMQVSKQGYTIWKPNATFPQVVGMVSTSCANQWGNRVTNLNQEVYVTGTNLASNNINLHTYFSDYFVGALWWRQNNTNGATSMSYKVFNSPIPWYPFASDQGVCYDLGVKFSLLFSSLNDCANGCAASGVLVKVSGSSSVAYVVQSNGVTTAPSRILRS